MRIKSNLDFNTSILANHKPLGDTKQSLVGSAQPDYVLIPAGSTLELSDEEWKKFAGPAAGLLESGSLTMLKAPALTKEEAAAKAAEELAAAEAVISASKEAAKAAKVEKTEK